MNYDEMVDWEYVAEDSRGRKIKNTIKAATAHDAQTAIQAQDLRPISIKEKKDSFLNSEMPGFRKKTKLKSLVIFAKQFALMLKAGMDILQSIEQAVEATEDIILKDALKEVHGDVKHGTSFSDALAKHPNAFPGLLVSVVRAGEEGGFLERSMESMAKTYKTDLELKQKVTSAMMYPSIVGVFTLLITAGMIIFIIPVFAELFESLDTELPAITRFLLMLSENAIIVVPSMLGFVGLTIGFFKYFKNEEWLRKFVDTVKFKAPVFGELNKKTAIARMCRNLSMMITAGEPLTSALKLTASTSDNIHIEISTKYAIEAMNDGTSFTNSLRYYEMFPPMVRQMISVGDESGSLAPMLDTVADFYENEVSEMSERLAAAIEPLMIIVLGGIVGVVLFAMYMPMFTMYGAMGDNM